MRNKVQRGAEWLVPWLLVSVVVVGGLWALWWLAPLPDEQAAPRAAPTAAVEAREWLAYWQDANDPLPTRLYESCPTRGKARASGWQIQPGQRFELRESDCAPYQGREVVGVRLETAQGVVEGYAVRLDSFAPIIGSAAAPAAQPDGLPLMISVANYQPRFGAVYLYAWYSEASIAGQGSAGLQRQLDELARVSDAGTTKMLMLSSVARLDTLLRDDGAALRQSGITVIGYNTERAVGTPEDEMNALGEVEGNPVARAAALADAAGFRLIWGPIRQTVDGVPDGALRAMVTAGLDGVALQEQKGIENESVAQRVAAVQRTAERYRRVGGDDFHISVQIMPSRCPARADQRWGRCTDFVAQIAPWIDSVAIWASSSADRAALPDLVAALPLHGGGR
ncbi:MAG: hypothetical protein H6638_00445 [Ardenticatenales bacterium]|nr:hypothetical protein [Ardenticatenales bacterium]